jgi:hypothetical protein
MRAEAAVLYEVRKPVVVPETETAGVAGPPADSGGAS